MKQISFVLMAILCAVGFAIAQEPIPRGEDDPSLVNSTAVVSIDSTGQIGGDFTNGFLPNNRLDVIWVDEPQYGTVQYDSERQLVSYEPSAENLDQLDKFTVYATDDGTSWNITRFFFDPTTNELTFATDLSNSPYEGASLMGSDQAVHCSTLGTPCRDGWTRLWGGVKLIGGALETTGGVIIGVGTSWTGVGAVAGGGIAVHGADTTQAGFRQLWSGEEVRTFTSQAVSGTAHHAFGVDSEKAVVIGEIVDATAGLAGGVGTIAKAPQIVDKFGDAFVLSAKTRTVFAGGGYLDDTIDISGNVADIIKAGGTITGGINGGRGADELNQLFSKIPDEFDIAPNRPLGERGPISGRPFDASNAGGPVRNLTTNRIKVTDHGIDYLEQHIARFGDDAANSGMVDRLRRISRDELQPTQRDLNFYSHELRESVRYRRLGHRRGAGDDYDLWNNAHTGTLEDYRLPDFDANGNRTLYHPDFWHLFE